MNKVQAQTKSVKQLLMGVKYGLDVFQREYDWGRRQIEDLLSDFENKFLQDYDESHSPEAVRDYPHYFLGTIITVDKFGKQYIVDGQQRLTTLTLLLTYFYRQKVDKLPHAQSIFDVSPLIYSNNYGEKSFNIDIAERRDCMNALYQRGEFDASDHPSLSVRNIAARFSELDELFPDALEGHAFNLFVYWFVEKVNIVEIEASSDEDAFTIFETMNDRGMNLSQADMLKGYLLSHIINSQNKTEANDEWRRLIKELVGVDAGAQEDFIKTWLRAQYADKTRERKKNAEDEDFEKIDKFHRWARDNSKRLNLHKPNDFYDFITRNFAFFSRYFIAMRQAARTLTAGREEIHYNAYNNFTLQYMLALAPLTPDDDDETAWRKIRLVTIFADIYLARRKVNFKRTGYSTLQYTMFNLARRIRNTSVDSLRRELHNELNWMWESMGGIIGEKDWLPPYYLNKFTGRSIRFLLARMTAWVEQQSGNNVNFRNFLWDANGRPLEIEHIWANQYEQHQHQGEYAHENDFQRERNYFGGLVLLPKGIHKPLGATSYEEKYKHYIGANLLAASLHAQMYEGKTGFKDFIDRTGLPFKAHSQFKRADLMQRQELYRQICEQIWSPDRLKAI